VWVIFFTSPEIINGKKFSRKSGEWGLIEEGKKSSVFYRGRLERPEGQRAA